MNFSIGNLGAIGINLNPLSLFNFCLGGGGGGSEEDAGKKSRP
jgi:hypothetical protein